VQQIIQGLAVRVIFDGIGSLVGTTTSAVVINYFLGLTLDMLDRLFIPEMSPNIG
jgi:hypothetical protein